MQSQIFQQSNNFMYGDLPEPNCDLGNYEIATTVLMQCGPNPHYACRQTSDFEGFFSTAISNPLQCSPVSVPENGPFQQQEAPVLEELHSAHMQSEQQLILGLTPPARTSLGSVMDFTFDANAPTTYARQMTPTISYPINQDSEIPMNGRSTRSFSFSNPPSCFNYRDRTLNVPSPGYACGYSGYHSPTLSSSPFSPASSCGGQSPRPQSPSSMVDHVSDEAAGLSISPSRCRLSQQRKSEDLHMYGQRHSAYPMSNTSSGSTSPGYHGHGGCRKASLPAVVTVERVNEALRASFTRSTLRAAPKSKRNQPKQGDPGYKDFREKNNKAVKESRERSKQKQQHEQNELQKHVESLQAQVAILKQTKSELQAKVDGMHPVLVLQRENNTLREEKSLLSEEKQRLSRMCQDYQLTVNALQEQLAHMQNPPYNFELDSCPGAL